MNRWRTGRDQVAARLDADRFLCNGRGARAVVRKDDQEDAMAEREQVLAERFGESREHLRSAAQHLLGSPAEGEDSTESVALPVGEGGAGERVREADSLGLDLFVVLEFLEPPERLAFVLHDLFKISLEEVAPMMGRTPAEAQELVRRARRRIRGGAVLPQPAAAQRREVVDAFLSAARQGDVDALSAVLDPDVVSRSSGVPDVRGASAVAKGAAAFARIARDTEPALINGSPGVIARHAGEILRAMAFEVEDRRITVIDVITDPERLRDLDMALLDG
ncbi:DNA-directed RNA polymerase specialized sigma24 family protein [Streptomyces phaeochromogenes]|uniref:RNA polymerase subunit sigma-70 n=1 Tax=Streptomyces phaeochromogenes TaxID=1923 RepID=UPI0027908A17|nr:RNA polymerase subunit sigma-70 [Streptomyces phaeochromogenes]MDQ0955760.1 DNA-directed RNA polymerase specialized sigma24 family protein [Streptomyces phaeochromogenes]